MVETTVPSVPVLQMRKLKQKDYSVEGLIGSEG